MADAEFVEEQRHMWKRKRKKPWNLWYRRTEDCPYTIMARRWRVWKRYETERAAKDARKAITSQHWWGKYEFLVRGPGDASPREGTRGTS